jgi:PAS domain S-box-containing protein
MSTLLALDSDFCTLLVESHRRLVGASLVDQDVPHTDAARWLYEEAPFSLLAHNTDPDPRFVYANRAAQQCFEYGWEEITSLRSRFSAEEPNREERSRLMQMVRTQGFINGYRGIRIAKSGRRFWIENGTVWNLVDREGKFHGQAATFSDWKDV